MGKHTNKEIKEIIIKLHKKGKKLKDIANIVQKPTSTIHDIITKENKQKYNNKEENRGRNNILNKYEKRIVSRTIKKDCQKSTKEVKEYIQERFNKKVSRSTVYNVIKELGFKSYIPRKKPLLTEYNIKIRKEFSSNFFAKSIGYWRNVIWSDECNFKLYNPNYQKRYWKNPSQEYQLPISITTTETKKYAGGTVMVWGCFSYYGKGKLIILDHTVTSTRYQQVLSENLIESANMMGLNEFIFQQDNAPAHTSNLLKQFFKENHIDLLPWPANSPDLNPIENIWGHISLELSKRSVKTINDMKCQILDIWQSLDTLYLQTLADSMPNRLREVIERNGKHANY